jgi:branched-chain amino acid transport system permease protein
MTGAVALRTSGVNFIMITLAFGQMAFFLATSLAAYGGDDGLTLTARSTLVGFPIMTNAVAFYYIVLACLVSAYLLCCLIIRSAFGRVLLGTRENALRMECMGVNPFHYRLAAYVISGCIAGLSGVLLANHTEFVSPAYMSWQRSGELMAMVVLGGSASVHGPILGAACFILIEEMLSRHMQYWKVVFGALLVLVAILPRGGFLRMLAGKS